MTPIMFDSIIAIVLLMSIGVAFFRGFVKEALTIVTLIGGAWAAFTFGDMFQPEFLTWLNDGAKEGEKVWGFIPIPLMASFLSYAAPFFAVFIILTLAGMTISSSIKAMGLGPVDRLLGMLFGAARGLLIILLCYAPFAFFVKVDDMPTWVKESMSIEVLNPTFQWAKKQIGDDEKTTDTPKEESAFEQKLKDLSNDDKFKNIKDIPQGDYTREQMDDFLNDSERNATPN